MQSFLRLILDFPSNPIELACLWTVFLCAVVIASTMAFDELSDF